MRKRLLFYIRKGNGMGHLRRMSRIADALSQDYSCLIIGGHSEMNWMVSSNCEYYQIPFCDHFNRSDFILHINEMYQPDAIFFDHSVNGNDGDIHQLLDKSKAMKFLILRGVLDSPEKTQEIYYNPSSLFYLNNKIDHIFVACDERIEDVSNYKFLNKSTLDRVSYIGYVTPTFSAESMDAYRSLKKRDSERYVVSTPGGGFKNYALLRTSVELAEKYADNTRWNIVYGPKNDKKSPFYPYDIVSINNTEIYKFSSDMDMMNASSDILITRGGYNNLVEGVYGNSYIICKPMGQNNDEQFIHATNLSQYYDKLIVVENMQELKGCFDDLMHLSLCDRPCQKHDLNMNGIENLRQKLNYFL